MPVFKNVYFIYLSISIPAKVGTDFTIFELIESD